MFIRTIVNIYKTKSNDVQTTFAGTLSGGIRLQHDDVDIRMTPYTADSGKVTASLSAVLSSDSKRITYALSEKVRYDNDVYGKAVPQLADFVGAHHQQIQNQSS